MRKRVLQTKKTKLEEIHTNRSWNFALFVNDQSEGAIQGVAQICETSDSKEPRSASQETATDIRQERIREVQT